MTVLDPLPPRLTLAYGSFAVDDTHLCILDGDYTLSESSRIGRFRICLQLRLNDETDDEDADDATFEAARAALETALRIPRQRLLVQLGTQDVVRWQYTGAANQTALMIEPELEVLEEHSRNIRYAFHVSCQLPGNVPGNVYRVESLTTIGESLRENRMVSISAAWTWGSGLTALAQFIDTSDGFYTAYLPANITDRFGNTGEWIRLSQAPQRNDEGSFVTCTATFIEVFGGGRRDSSTKQIVNIGNRRTLMIPNEWFATPDGTALENYMDNGGSFYGAVLAATPNVDDGEWVQVDEQFATNDQDGNLIATLVYEEVVLGLRNYEVQSTADASGLRTLVVTGTYYETQDNTAKENYTDNIAALIAGVIAAEVPTITHSDSTSVPLVAGYDQNQQRYVFRWTIRELAYPEDGGASPEWDSTTVAAEFLELEMTTPFEAFSVTDDNPITFLQRGTARFACGINYQESQDPADVWDDSLRAHVIYAIEHMLGATIGIHVTEERVSPNLSGNSLSGFLSFIVIGGSVLRCYLSQQIDQTPGRDFAGFANGLSYNYRDFKDLPEKTLLRIGYIEYVVGTGPPALFAPGDNVVSGFGFIDTGITAQDSIDAQNAAGPLDDVPEDGMWFIDRRAGPPYRVKSEPRTLGDGDGLQTVEEGVIENWRFVATLADST